MRVTEVNFDGAVPIDGYGPGFFRVGKQIIEGPVLVTAARATQWGGFSDLAPLMALKGEVDVIFLGMGAEIAHAPVDLRDQLEALGMGVEVMNSPAACRTYNVLVSEGRRVAAALLPVGEGLR
ncbi:Mth938-like domain-containing protein [Seohaeicola saemankumensis]|uniref:Mth938-like domain-containing protein n=1 Tax=Seohaeicola saemankumensis TaxID=481181 RepID=A0ABW3TAL7_9RHOB|nr:Mth938-like domain-containing protein [Paracoccaceae bacterium]